MLLAGKEIPVLGLLLRQKMGGEVGRVDFCFFIVTQPLTVSTVLSVDCKGERRKISPSLWFKKSIQ
jgi:hypothetical protein